MDTKQEIVSRLKFIGKVKKGEKINTRHMYVQPAGLTTTISRTFINQDNRGNALSFCQDTVQRAFELLNSYRHSISSPDQVAFNHLLTDLRNATTGLHNLKVTYITDTKFCCDMDTLLESIEARLSDFKISEFDQEESKVPEHKNSILTTVAKQGDFSDETKDNPIKGVTESVSDSVIVHNEKSGGKGKNRKR